MAKMWSGSKKTYILNHSCMEFSPDKELMENPFCFSIPLCYFNLLDDGTGEIFIKIFFPRVTHFLPVLPSQECVDFKFILSLLSCIKALEHVLNVNIVC